MKTRKKKDFDTVKFFRKIKTRISIETYGMGSDELRAYFSSGPKIFQRKPGEA